MGELMGVGRVAAAGADKGWTKSRPEVLVAVWCAAGPCCQLTMRLRKWCVTSTALRALHSMFLRTSSAVLGGGEGDDAAATAVHMWTGHTN